MLLYRLPWTGHLQTRRWPGSVKKKCLGTCDQIDLITGPTTTCILGLQHCWAVNQKCQELSYCKHYIAVYVASNNLQITYIDLWCVVQFAVTVHTHYTARIILDFQWVCPYLAWELASKEAHTTNNLSKSKYCTAPWLGYIEPCSKVKIIFEKP